MQLTLNKNIAAGYTSSSQKVRVLTESWVSENIYCPNCGTLRVEEYPNNKPVADFFCSSCHEDYELKSKKDSFGTKIVDGAYDTMIERLGSSTNPNFFFLNYEIDDFSIKNFVVIPKHFFVPKIIEKRKPLALTARRAGWVGCNILLQGVPETGKIFYIQNGRVKRKEDVLSKWQKTLFLREENDNFAKGWLLDVMQCVERIGNDNFTLDEIYRFKDELKDLHPDNNHIKDKIRQQLQVLRDKGYLEFTARGHYRLT